MRPLYANGRRKRSKQALCCSHRPQGRQLSRWPSTKGTGWTSIIGFRKPSSPESTHRVGSEQVMRPHQQIQSGPSLAGDWSRRSLIQRKRWTVEGTKAGGLYSVSSHTKGWLDRSPYPNLVGFVTGHIPTTNHGPVVCTSSRTTACQA